MSTYPYVYINAKIHKIKCLHTYIHIYKYTYIQIDINKSIYTYIYQRMNANEHSKLTRKVTGGSRDKDRPQDGIPP
jgi:hypothetical protein